MYKVKWLNVDRSITVDHFFKINIFDFDRFFKESGRHLAPFDILSFYTMNVFSIKYYKLSMF